MPRAGAQNTENSSAWYKPFYIEAGGVLNILPKLFLGDIKPMFGFHGALGYEWQRIRFSLSSGYSQAAGSNPFVEDIYFIPITARVGYALPIKNNWGVEGDLGFGMQLSRTLHYENNLDLLAGRRSESQEIKPLAEARVYATYTILNNLLKFYAGGGVDVIFETNSPIPVPVIELGISIKPLALYSPREHKTVTPVPKPIAEPAVEPEPEPEEPYQEPIAEPEPEPEEPYQEPITEPEPEPEEPYQEKTDVRPTRFQYAIYFEANRGTKILDLSWPLLREAGRMLQENPEARITLRGYAAPSGTTESQVVISAARVWFCVEYFKQEFDIAEDRINMQFFGAEEAHLSPDEEWELRRRVELIVEFPPDEEAGTPASKQETESEPSVSYPYDTDIVITPGQILLQRSIYFEPNRGTKVLARSMPLLREAGRLLRRNPGARIILRGYAAPSGTTESQVVLSAARVWVCVEYFKQEFNIAEDRIRMQFFGAEKTPISKSAEWQLRRRVELIIIRGR
jgi:outer membrane protein OmpA-like peptidoglycan-associated protein